MSKLCVEKTNTSALHTQTQLLGHARNLFLSLTHRHACAHTHTHTHTHTVLAGQWLVHVNHALNGLWNRLGQRDSISTPWIAKQIQLGLPVTNINNRLTLFFYRLNVIFPRHAKWIAAIEMELIWDEAGVGCSRRVRRWELIKVQLLC